MSFDDVVELENDDKKQLLSSLIIFISKFINFFPKITEGHVFYFFIFYLLDVGRESTKNDNKALRSTGEGD